MKVELRKCGESLTFALPPELVSELHWEPGDICECHIEADGLRIVRTETAHDHVMKIAREVMDEYRDVFEALAKS
jgi:antitoxin component of MazEF toxin-antitoxin module